MLTQLDTLIGFVVVMALVSLLITIITQMVSSLFGLRGKCLAEALEAMIYKIDKSIEPGVRLALIDRLLMHPAISDSVLSMDQPFKIFWRWNPGWWQWLVKCWKRASAIRPDELLTLLEGIAGEQPPPAGQAPNAANAGSLNPDPKVKQAAVQILKQLQNVSDLSKEGLQALRNAMPKLAETKGAAALDELDAAANHALNNLEGWFNSSQDRAREWFAMHTRVVTVAASVVMAFVLQLDTVALFQQLSTDKELRDSLVKTAVEGNLVKIANPVLTNEINLATNTDSAVYQQNLQQNLSTLTNAFSQVVQVSSQAGLQLLPEPYPFQLAVKWPPITYTPPWSWSWPPRHLFGILLSASLLSLGAPFWFNMLKSLANLRSSLANQIDDNPKQS